MRQLEKCIVYSNSLVDDVFLSLTGYAGSPKNVKYKYYPYSRSYALYWEQPSTHNGHWVRKYVLEEWKENKAMWVQRHNITTLTVTVKNIESTKRYRICSANEIGYKNTSCSKSVVLRKSICTDILILLWQSNQHLLFFPDNCETTVF